MTHRGSFADMNNKMKIENRVIDEAMEMLRGMVGIPSVSFSEDEVCGYVSEILSEHGVRHERVKNNITALNRDFDPEKKTLMLCAHLDTVPVCDGYSFDPYRPDYVMVRDIFGCGEDEIVCGLGSNDDGGSVVAMCAAFRHFYDKDMPCNLVLVLSCEEERSGPGGMAWIWEHYGEIAGLKHAGRPDWAIVGEPTGMKAATSERGLLVIDGEAEGVSGHAAREEGVNALYIAMDDIRTLRDFNFSRISPLMGTVKLTVTQINAGTVHNVVPDRCSFVVDIRPTEQYTNAEILAMLQSECRSTLTARNLKNRSSATAPDSPLLGCAEALGIETFVSPTTSDWMRIGCDAIKMGPGDSARSHRKYNEVYRSAAPAPWRLHTKSAALSASAAPSSPEWGDSTRTVERPPCRALWRVSPYQSVLPCSAH